MRFVLTAETLLPDDAVQAVATPTAGAVVTFIGTVRDHARGQRVTRLEYEAYPAMALAMFERIAAEAGERWPGCEVAIHHRTGACAVGAATVSIAAAAPHRADAFAACRHAIERLKADAPIWKREFYEDGSAWIGQGS